jgi:hypothetical protein
MRKAEASAGKVMITAISVCGKQARVPRLRGPRSENERKEKRAAPVGMTIAQDPGAKSEPGTP